jgi:hypothetical protein
VTLWSKGRFMVIRRSVWGGRGEKGEAAQAVISFFHCW